MLQTWTDVCANSGAKFNITVFLLVTCYSRPWPILQKRSVKTLIKKCKASSERKGEATLFCCVCTMYCVKLFPLKGFTHLNPLIYKHFLNFCFPFILDVRTYSHKNREIGGWTYRLSLLLLSGSCLTEKHILLRRFVML